VGYQFLSDEWIAEARKIRAEFTDAASPPPLSIRMNQVVTDVPFGEGTILAHLDTSAGTLEIDLGHLPDPDLTITLDYDTAKVVLIDGDAQAAMAAFLGGKIKVDGDITKLLALQMSDVSSAGTGGRMAEIYHRVQDITA